MFWTILLIAVVGGAFAAVVYPLLRPRRAWAVVTVEGALELLGKEKARVLRELKDLELERESGAVQADDYEELRRAYLDDAAMINRRLSALQRDSGVPPSTRETEPEEEAASAAEGTG